MLPDSARPGDVTSSINMDDDIEVSSTGPCRGGDGGSLFGKCVITCPRQVALESRGGELPTPYDFGGPVVMGKDVDDEGID